MSYRDQLFPTQHQHGCLHICHFIFPSYCGLRNSMLFQPVSLLQGSPWFRDMLLSYIRSPESQLIVLSLFAPLYKSSLLPTGLPPALFSLLCLKVMCLRSWWVTHLSCGSEGYGCGTAILGSSAPFHHSHICFWPRGCLLDSGWLWDDGRRVLTWRCLEPDVEPQYFR